MENHHAFLHLGRGISLSVLPKKYQVQSPDVVHKIFDTLGINDVREIRREAFLRPIESDVRVFVIIPQTITVEAQNALLKLLEEPPPTAVFYMLLENENVLLPTLHSRFFVTDHSHQANEESFDIAEFIDVSLRKRITLVSDLAKSKDQKAIDNLLSSLEEWVIKNNIHDSEILNSLSIMRTYGRQKGSSTKMLLEHIALSLPQKK